MGKNLRQKWLFNKILVSVALVWMFMIVLWSVILLTTQPTQQQAGQTQQAGMWAMYIKPDGVTNGFPHLNAAANWLIVFWFFGIIYFAWSIWYAQRMNTYFQTTRVLSFGITALLWVFLAIIIGGASHPQLLTNGDSSGTFNMFYNYKVSGDIDTYGFNSGGQAYLTIGILYILGLLGLGYWYVRQDLLVE